MYADKQFLTALAGKLTELSEETSDLKTRADLDELIDLTHQQIAVQDKPLFKTAKPSNTEK